MYAATLNARKSNAIIVPSEDSGADVNAFKALSSARAHVIERFQDRLCPGIACLNQVTQCTLITSAQKEGPSLFIHDSLPMLIDHQDRSIATHDGHQLGKTVDHGLELR